MEDRKDILKYLQKREELLNKRDAVKAEKEAELSTINARVEEQSQLVAQLKKEYFLTLDKNKETEYKQALELLNGLESTKKELDADIVVGDLIDTIEYDYPDFHLSMDCFWCELQSEHVVLNEHEDAKWLSRAQLDSVDWLPADVTLVDKIAKGM